MSNSNLYPVSGAVALNRKAVDGFNFSAAELQLKFMKSQILQHDLRKLKPFERMKGAIIQVCYSRLFNFKLQAGAITSPYCDNIFLDRLY